MATKGPTASIEASAARARRPPRRVRLVGHAPVERPRHEDVGPAERLEHTEPHAAAAAGHNQRESTTHAGRDGRERWARRDSSRGRRRRRIPLDGSDKFTRLEWLERAEWLVRGRCCVLPDHLRGPEAQDGEAQADAEPNQQPTGSAHALDVHLTLSAVGAAHQPRLQADDTTDS